VTDIISKVHKTPSVPLLTIETEEEYTLQCSHETELWTPDGWIRAENLQIGDTIYCNGDPDDRYKDKDFLMECKTKGMKYAEIAKACNISERTIRAYMKRYGINDGKTGALVGDANPNYKGENVSKKGGYMRMSSLAIDRIHSGELKGVTLGTKGLLNAECEGCNVVGPVDIHHRNRDATDNSLENWQFLCDRCHSLEHIGPTIRHVRKSVISNIFNSGIDVTYDVSIPSGSWVAQGFIIKSI